MLQIFYDDFTDDFTESMDDFTEEVRAARIALDYKNIERREAGIEAFYERFTARGRQIPAYLRRKFCPVERYNGVRMEVAQ